MVRNARLRSLVGLSTLVVLVGMLTSPAAVAQCPVIWEQTTLPSTFGTVWGATVWDDGSGAGPRLYMSGELSFNGTVDNNVIRWDGDHWTPVGASFHHTSGYAIVHVLGIFNGELIAAGDFQYVGDVFCDRIARWNGTAWAPLGGGRQDVIYAMTVYNGQLVTAGEPNAPVAIWNGTSWQNAGCCVSSGAVNALAVYHGQLIAGSILSSPNGLAVLDGATWKPFSGGVDGFVNALTVYNDELIVGGQFAHAGGVAANNVARWNGSRWAPLGSGTSGGNAWVNAFANDGGNLIVGGAFTRAGGINSNRVASWNGSSWSSLAGGVEIRHNDAEVRALAAWNGRIAAGGWFWQFAADSSYWALATTNCAGCDDSSDCSDGQFCNGVETCSNGTCLPGTSPCAAPSKCRESDDQCVQCLTDADCSDGTFCNGIETCSAAGTCQAGAPPCTATQMCRESDDRCVSCLANADCDDGLFCNGVETCSAAGTCQAGSNPCPGQSCDESHDTCTSSGPELWLSFASATAVPGLGTVADEDIVSYNLTTHTWSMVFDGSDVGLSRLAIDGMARMSDGSILLSFTAAGNVPGLTGGPAGTSVDDSDMVRFIPTSLGANTAGSFVFHFDGSDVGLTMDNEDIDGIALTPNGQLVISTVGAVSANGASGADTDLLLFNATSLGSNTSGSFSVYFDGSDVGLSDNGNEDVDAVSILSNGQILLSTLGNFSVPGVSGANEDVIRFAPTQVGATTSGTYSMYLDLSALDIATSADVSAMELKE